MRILLTGKNGQVGFELQRALAPLGEVFAFDRAGCDLESELALRSVVRAVNPDVIVNSAAYTAVDAAETDYDRAMAVNATAPGILADEAARCGAMVIHYSTDYVFDGETNGYYKEDAPAFPRSVYGASKLAGEENVKRSGASHLIFRTSWVFGVHGSNFAKRILQLATEKSELKVVSDQVGAPTSAELIASTTAHAILQASENPQTFEDGIYHLAAHGETTWHGYACHLLQAATKAGGQYSLHADRIVAVTSDKYPTAARRPLNSRLDTSKITGTFRLELPPWQHHVDLFVRQVLNGGY